MVEARDDSSENGDRHAIKPEDMMKMLEKMQAMRDPKAASKHPLDTFNQVLLDLEKFAESLGKRMRDNIVFPEPTMFTSRLDDVDIKVEGPQLLQASIYCGKPEFVKLLAEKGVDLN